MAPVNRYDGVPGLIMSTASLSSQLPSVAPSFAELARGNGVSTTPTLLVSSGETSLAFEHSDELALLKSVASLIAQQVSPHLKTGIDAVWLVYRAAQLRDAWQQPNRDTVACGFKMTGLVLSAATLTGNLYPGLALPDAWANGFNYVLKSGEAIHAGKTVPVNELAFGTDKRMDIPLKLLKLAGLSLDPQPYAATLPGLFVRPTLKPLMPGS
jgi:hypothetical protein